MQTLQCFVLTLHGRVTVSTVTQFVRQGVEVKTDKEVIDGLCTHLADELVGVAIVQIVIVGRHVVVEQVVVLLLRQQVIGSRTQQRVALAVLLSCQNTWLNDHVTLVVNDGIELLGRHTQQIANLVGQTAEVPDVCHRHHQLNMTSALTTNFLLGHLDTTTITNDAFIADALVFSAGTLIVLGRTEDALAEQAVALRLVSAVVDGFGLGDLAERAFEDFLGRSQSDSNLGEITLYL